MYVPRKLNYLVMKFTGGGGCKGVVPHPISRTYFSDNACGTAGAIKSPRLSSVSLDRHAARRLPFPLSKLRGDLLTATGAFWPNTTAAIVMVQDGRRHIEIVRFISILPPISL
jgi:hypothetical protein